jgi:MoaA/NifB/PqqE/SkfB family radical SAM enzyme
MIQQWPAHWKNHSLNVDHLMKFLDCDLQGVIIEMCGNYGDPIYHPDLPDLVSKLKSRGAVISITTNGSYRTKNWWNLLCDQLDSSDQISFSIDGIPDNFTQYRVNADWQSIELGIKTCVTRKIKVNWKYIVFSYNQDNIESAAALSDQLGVHTFMTVHSDRFDEQTYHLMPSNTFVGDLKPLQDQFKQSARFDVDPKCANGRQYYISATGHFSPCCFLSDHRFYYKTIFGKDRQSYDISNTTFLKLMQSPNVVNFYASIKTAPALGCQYNCPKVNS